MRLRTAASDRARTRCNRRTRQAARHQQQRQPRRTDGRQAARRGGNHTRSKCVRRGDEAGNKLRITQVIADAKSQEAGEGGGRRGNVSRRPSEESGGGGVEEGSKKPGSKPGEVRQRAALGVRWERGRPVQPPASSLSLLADPGGRVLMELAAQQRARTKPAANGGEDGEDGADCDAGKGQGNAVVVDDLEADGEAAVDVDALVEDCGDDDEAGADLEDGAVASGGDDDDDEARNRRMAAAARKQFARRKAVEAEA